MIWLLFKYNEFFVDQFIRIWITIYITGIDQGVDLVTRGVSKAVR